jgi:hypothetical protein
MSLNRLIGLFHVKHTNRPGLPGRIRFGIPVPEGLPVQQEPACT